MYRGDGGTAAMTMAAAAAAHSKCTMSMRHKSAQVVKNPANGDENVQNPERKTVKTKRKSKRKRQKKKYENGHEMTATAAAPDGLMNAISSNTVIPAKATNNPADPNTQPTATAPAQCNAAAMTVHGDQNGPMVRPDGQPDGTTKMVTGEK